MNILIIGGAGFVGRYTTAYLVSKGHKVTIVDKKSEQEVRKDLGPLFEKIRFGMIDASNREALCVLMDGVDMVFHMAASPDVRNPNEIDTFETTKAIISCMSRMNVKRILYTSTSATYGIKERPCREDDELDPISDYGRHKTMSEALIQKACEDSNVNGTILRFANVVGPGQTHGVVLDFVRKLENDNTRLEILGNGTQTKEYVHILDVISAIDVVLSTPAEGVEIYNISSDPPISVREIADIVCETMGLRDVDYRLGDTEFGWPGDIPRFSLDTSKLRSMGWKATYSSEEAVRDAAEHIFKGTQGIQLSRSVQ